MPPQAYQVPGRDRLTIHDDAAFLARQKAVDQLECGGFSGTATPQQHQRLSAQYAKVEFRKKHAPFRRAVGNIDKLDCSAFVPIGHERPILTFGQKKSRIGLSRCIRSSKNPMDGFCWKVYLLISARSLREISRTTDNLPKMICVH